MKKSILIVLFSVFFSTVAFAVDLGDVSQTLMGPTALLTKLLLFAGYVIGAMLMIGAIAQYRNHLQSPKLVPLTTPIMLFILGIALVLVPYISTRGTSGSAIEQQKREGVGTGGASLLEPEYVDENPAGPGRLPEDQPQAPSTPSSESNTNNSSGSGHWSQDPRYRR